MKKNISKEKKQCKAQIEDPKENIKVQIKKARENIDENKQYFLKCRRSTGKGQFSNLFWWMITLNTERLKEEYKKSGYVALLLTPYIADYSTFNMLFDSAHKLIKATDIDAKIYWGKTKEEPLPHIDSTTGNFHVEFDENQWDGKIKQIRLVRNTAKGSSVHYGPRLDDNDKKQFAQDELLTLTADILVKESREIKEEKIYVPKVCYHPRVDEPASCEDITDIEAALKNMIDLLFD